MVYGRTWSIAGSKVTILDLGCSGGVLEDILTVKILACYSFVTFQFL